MFNSILLMFKMIWGAWIYIWSMFHPKSMLLNLIQLSSSKYPLRHFWIFRLKAFILILYKAILNVFKLLLIKFYLNFKIFSILRSRKHVFILENSGKCSEIDLLPLFCYSDDLKSFWLTNYSDYYNFVLNWERFRWHKRCHKTEKI